MKLPNNENAIITHYGCSAFESNTHTVYWIGAIYYEKKIKKYFYVSGNEKDNIKEYFDFIRKNKHKKFLHWSMNSPKYGFKALGCRYEELTSHIIDSNFIDDLDLSEYFKEKYGINYIERKGGRLNNLATLNGFSGVSNKIEISLKNEAVNRLELLFSIYQAEQQGFLKVETNKYPELSANEQAYAKRTHNPKYLSKEAVIQAQNNLIANVNIEDVYDYFKVLIEVPNRKGEFYLTEKKLLIFLKSTFTDLAPIKQNFNVSFSRDKRNVRSVFYKFQNFCFDSEYNKSHLKRKYFGIMFNGFNGFDEKEDWNKWHVTNNKIPTLKNLKVK